MQRCAGPSWRERNRRWRAVSALRGGLGNGAALMSGSDKQIQHCRGSETAAVYIGRPARNGKPGMPCTAKCNRIRYRTAGNGKRAFPAMLQSRRLSRVKPGAVMPNLRPFTATAQPLTPFSGVKMSASGQINGQFSLIEGIMVSGGAANRYRIRERA